MHWAELLATDPQCCRPSPFTLGAESGLHVSQVEHRCSTLSKMPLPFGDIDGNKDEGEFKVPGCTLTNYQEFLQQAGCTSVGSDRRQKMWSWDVSGAVCSVETGKSCISWYQVLVRPHLEQHFQPLSRNPKAGGKNI